MGIKEKLQHLLAPATTEALPTALAAKPRKLSPSIIATAAQAAKDGQVETLQRLYLDMESYDAQVCAEYNARRARLSSAPWEVQTPLQATPRELLASRQVQQILANTPAFVGVIHDLSDAIGKGFASAEIIWELRDGLLAPADFISVEQTQFRFVERRQHLRNARGEYDPLIPDKWITHSRSPFSGDPWVRGLFLPLLICHMYKSYSVQDWGEYLERFGIPTVIGKYPDGATTDFRDALKKAVTSIKSGAMGIVGMSTEIDLIQPPSGGLERAFSDHVVYWDQQISKILSGGTLTGNASAIGSYGQARVHADGANTLARRDARALESSITQGLIEPICRLNGLLQTGDRLPQLRFNLWSAAEAQGMTDFLIKAQQAGLHVPQDWAHNLVGIPQPCAKMENLETKTGGI